MTVGPVVWTWLIGIPVVECRSGSVAVARGGTLIVTPGIGLALDLAPSVGFLAEG